jgi:hypothetical protein
MTALMAPSGSYLATTANPVDSDGDPGSENFLPTRAPDSLGASGCS